MNGIRKTSFYDFINFERLTAGRLSYIPGAVFSLQKKASTDRVLQENPRRPF